MLRIIIAKFGLLFTVCCRVFTQDLYGCPSHLPNSDRVAVYAGKCYHFVHKEEYWTGARSFCNDHRGDLLKLDNPNLNDFIKSQIQDIGWRVGGIWIGLNDREDEGSFHWESRDGVEEVAHWTNWAGGHPSDLLRNDRDCVYMDRGDGWRWHEDHCNGWLISDERRFICEYPYTGTTTLDPNASTDQSNVAPFKAEESPQNSYTLAYVGIGLGLLVFLILVVILIIFLLRRQRKRKMIEHRSDASRTEVVMNTMSVQQGASQHQNDAYLYDTPPSYGHENDENYAHELPQKSRF